MSKHTTTEATSRVTPKVINDVAFISQTFENLVPDGRLFEVAVIHHTQCGAGALADDTFRSRYAQRISAEESTLRERAILDPTATVTRDVERLRSADAISPRVAVSGHIYDVVTRRSSRPATKQTEAPNNPSKPKETNNHDDRRCPRIRVRPAGKRTANKPRAGRGDLVPH